MKFVMLEHWNTRQVALCVETGTLVSPSEATDCTSITVHGGHVLVKGTVAEVVGKLEGFPPDCDAPYDELRLEFAKARAERDRYRAALERIKSIPFTAENGQSVAWEIADAALGEQT